MNYLLLLVLDIIIIVLVMMDLSSFWFTLVAVLLITLIIYAENYFLLRPLVTNHRGFLKRYLRGHEISEVKSVIEGLLQQRGIAYELSADTYTEQILPIAPKIRYALLFILKKEELQIKVRAISSQFKLIVIKDLQATSGEISLNKKAVVSLLCLELDRVFPS